MKSLIIVTSILLLAAAVPTASAEPLPETGPICSEVLGACVNDPTDPIAIDKDRIIDLIGPCTCPPVE
jgi:hypothetical protein